MKWLEIVSCLTDFTILNKGLSVFSFYMKNYLISFCATEKIKLKNWLI